MKELFAAALVFLFFGSASAQTAKPSPVTLFNNFQDYTSGKLNLDSALYAAEKLGSDERSLRMLSELLHNSFAQEFIQPDAKPERLLFVNQLLTLMATDTVLFLRRAARPIYLFSRVQAAANDKDSLTALTNEFIASELTPAQFYTNKTGRYGLMIHKIIVRHMELGALSDRLLKAITISLKENQVRASDTLSRQQWEKRAWYRWLYAYVNHLQAEQTKDLKKKEIFLKTAFDHSPDLSDRNYRPSYFYDWHFLVGKGDLSFADPYYHFITENKKDRKQVLSLLENIALTDPSWKTRLRDYYMETSLKQEFESYWMNAINRKAKPAPDFLLTQIDGSPVSVRTNSGKWVLIDFWGTWCIPCREEHPTLQQFYDSTILVNAEKLVLVTIACSDTKDKVQAYMQEKKYSFPVAMSDNLIEKKYGVQGYPTKILITPAGKYVLVPFGVDWVEFVKEYCM